MRGYPRVIASKVRSLGNGIHDRRSCAQRSPPFRVPAQERASRLMTPPFVLRKSACGSAYLFQRREGRWREYLVADARDDRSIALAVVAHPVPSRIALECRPSRFPICKRVPREYVG